MKLPPRNPRTLEELEELVKFVAEMGHDATAAGTHSLMTKMLGNSGNISPSIHESLNTAFIMGVVFCLKCKSELGVDLYPLLLSRLEGMLTLKKVGKENPGG